MKLLIAIAFALALLPGCATAGPTATTAWISIDDGIYPTFNIGKKDPANTKIPATKEQVARWKAALAAYQQAQKEIGDAVSHYEPFAIDAKKIRKPERK